MIPCLIVPVLTRHELLTRFVASISHPVGDLVIINNQSGNQRWDKPEHVERIHHIDIPTNLGVAASWNLGIKAMPYADYWLIANFDVVLNRFLLEDLEARSARDKLVLSSANPPWCVFTIGADLIDRVGLFDESLYPAYFEDNDMERRAQALGFTIEQSNLSAHHDNSSTLAAGYGAKNATTYLDNSIYYHDKVARGDLSPGTWSLSRRIRNRWD